MKVLVATDKPFAKKAVDGIRSIVEQAGMTLDLLESYTSQEQLLGSVADADALIVRSDQVTSEVVQAAKRLRIVVRAGAGYDNLDLDACSRNNIVAMNTPGQNSNAVAELAIGMMVYMARKQFQPGTGTELRGKTLGVHAYGNVAVWWPAWQGLWNGSVCVRSLCSGLGHAGRIGHVANTLEDLYCRSDYLSLHIPANNETKGSIGKSLLSLMPKGACLINTARKEVINETELEEVLAERKDLKYATDVAPGNMEALRAQFDTRVFSTPKKMGAQTEEANINAGLAAARQIVAFFRDGDTTFQLNK